MRDVEETYIRERWPDRWERERKTPSDKVRRGREEGDGAIGAQCRTKASGMRGVAPEVSPRRSSTVPPLVRGGSRSLAGPLSSGAGGPLSPSASLSKRRRSNSLRRLPARRGTERESTGKRDRAANGRRRRTAARPRGRAGQRETERAGFRPRGTEINNLGEEARSTLTGCIPLVKDGNPRERRRGFRFLCSRRQFPSRLTN